jgi:hypothetical protein
MFGVDAGFAEGAQAGYEFGLVKSSLQVLTAHLAKDDSRQAKVGAACFLQCSLYGTAAMPY